MGRATLELRDGGVTAALSSAYNATNISGEWPRAGSLGGVPSPFCRSARCTRSRPKKEWEQRPYAPKTAFL